MVRNSSIENVQTGVDELIAEILWGIVEFDLAESPAPEFALELGLSLWIRRVGRELEAVRPAVMQLRRALVEVGGLDLSTEPAPFLGVSGRTDALNLVAYACDLMRRASVSSGRSGGELASRAVEWCSSVPTAPRMGDLRVAHA